MATVSHVQFPTSTLFLKSENVVSRENAYVRENVMLRCRRPIYRKLSLAAKSMDTLDRIREKKFPLVLHRSPYSLHSPASELVLQWPTYYTFPVH